MTEKQKPQKRGCKRIAGLDEAGRGPLAGPVVAAAVIVLSKRMLPKRDVSMLTSRLGKPRDSKQLSARQREEWYRLFLRDPKIQWGIGKVAERVIDRINIYQATRLAMQRAVSNLETALKKQSPLFYGRSKVVALDALIIDGTMLLDLPVSQRAVIKADETVLSCTIASVIAKVTRDRLMQKYHLKYPEYGFDKHKGYGTPQHLTMLSRHGPCAIHRRSFRPLAHLRN